MTVGATCRCYRSRRRGRVKVLTFQWRHAFLRSRVPSETMPASDPSRCGVIWKHLHSVALWRNNAATSGRHDLFFSAPQISCWSTIASCPWPLKICAWSAESTCTESLCDATVQQCQTGTCLLGQLKALVQNRSQCNATAQQCQTATCSCFGQLRADRQSVPAPNSKHWFTTSFLQPLSGDKECPFSGVPKPLQSLEEGAGKRCSDSVPARDLWRPAVSWKHLYRIAL